MADLFRRSFLFAAGALAATAAVVRVRSSVMPAPVEHPKELLFAVLAEGSQWEVQIHGGPMRGTYHIDVPGHLRELPPGDRMTVVDKIMRRVADGAKKTAHRQIAAPLKRIA